MNLVGVSKEKLRCDGNEAFLRTVKDQHLCAANQNTTSLVLLVLVSGAHGMRQNVTGNRLANLISSSTGNTEVNPAEDSRVRNFSHRCRKVWKSSRSRLNIRSYREWCCIPEFGCKNGGSGAAGS